MQRRDRLPRNCVAWQPVAVGRTLPDFPLFLTPELYVNVPLDATYQAAWHGVPARWKRVLEELTNEGLKK
jgi:hypothetical protein